MQPSSDIDTAMMAIALRMAERGLGATAPNPSVGAVIFDESTGELISRGWTQPGGRPHAETEAIARAGGRARAKTIYVTLEPCSHYGRTAPCAEAIIAAGLKRVVCGILDPDPRVSGRGIRMLRDAGLEVTRGVLAAEANWLTRGHIQRVTERRPWIQLKMALAADGTVAHGTGVQPTWVTGPEARAHGHLLRARADAIMVGSGTVRDDDPELTCRLPGLTLRSPVRVVVTGHELPLPGSKLVRSAREVAVWIFVAPEAGADRCAALERAGCRVFHVATVGGRPWLPAVCEALVGEGITRLLVEGGPTLWRAFSASGLADEIVCYRAGGAAESGTGAAPGTETLAATLARVTHGVLQPGARDQGYELCDSRPVGADTVHVFRRK